MACERSSAKNNYSLFKHIFDENLVHNIASFVMESGYQFIEFKIFQSANCSSVGLKFFSEDIRMGF